MTDLCPPVPLVWRKRQVLNTTHSERSKIKVRLEERVESFLGRGCVCLHMCVCAGWGTVLALEYP